jgi:hypothetical protein
VEEKPESALNESEEAAPSETVASEAEGLNSVPGAPAYGNKREITDEYVGE